MDGSRPLIAPPPSAPHDAAPAPADTGHCPRCRAAWDSLVPVRSSTLGDLDVRRCPSCGGRSTVGADPRPVLTCACGVPFVANGVVPGTDRADVPAVEARCPECLDDADAGLASGDVVGAIEHEVRLALEEDWSFVGSPALHAYLDGVAAEVARVVPGTPAAASVLVADEWIVRSLGLPSGGVILSLGLLGAIEDEAELAFVLAHDLFHAASGDTAGRLVRLGMRSVARDGGSGGRELWTRAAIELVRLGHGDERERAADDAALAAMTALRYDASSATRLLRRLGERAESGDWHLRDWALAHPPAGERCARLEARRAAGLLETPRVNREPFRRAAGAAVLSSGLSRVDGPAVRLAAAAAARDQEPRGVGRFAVWIVVGALAVAGAVAAVLLST